MKVLQQFDSDVATLTVDYHGGNTAVFSVGDTPDDNWHYSRVAKVVLPRSDIEKLANMLSALAQSMILGG